MLNFVAVKKMTANQKYPTASSLQLPSNTFLKVLHGKCHLFMLQVYDLFLCICPFPKSFQCLVPQFLPDQKEKRNVHFALRTRTERHFITAYISTSEYLFHFLWPGFFIALSLLCSLVLLSLMCFILPAIIQLEILITVEISLKT